jgi:hypothetical protein
MRCSTLLRSGFTPPIQPLASHPIPKRDASNHPIPEPILRQIFSRVFHNLLWVGEGRGH